MSGSPCLELFPKKVAIYFYETFRHPAAPFQGSDDIENPSSIAPELTADRLSFKAS